MKKIKYSITIATLDFIDLKLSHSAHQNELLYFIT